MTDKIEPTDGWCSTVHAVAEAIFFMFKIGEALLEPTARLYITDGVCYEVCYRIGHNFYVFRPNATNLLLIHFLELARPI